MSITYYAYAERELPYAGVQPDDLVIYTGTIRDSLLNGPTSVSCSSKAYAYRWMGDWAEEINIDFTEETHILDAISGTKDDGGYHVLDITSGAGHYVFLLNKARTFLRQVFGPKKPVVVANLGADAIRVDTFLGKYSIPSGTVLRLDESAPQREKKSVLLTFGEKQRVGSPLESAMLLDGVRWRSLITYANDSSIQVKDGPFVVQTLTYHGCESGVTLKDRPVDSDYEIYFRYSTQWGPKVRFAGLGMKDEGLNRKHRHFYPECGVIYDFQKLCQAPTIALMKQCTVQLPGSEDADNLPEWDVPWPETRETETKSGVPNFWPPDWPDLPSVT